MGKTNPDAARHQQQSMIVVPAAIVTMAAGMAVFTISYNDMVARIAAGSFGKAVPLGKFSSRKRFQWNW